MDYQKLVNDFHQLYFSKMIQRELEGEIESWLGYPILKCPLDLWVYQEIILRTE